MGDECLEFSEKLHWHLDKFYDSSSADLATLPPSVGHFFEDQMAAFVARETDEAKVKLKRGFCDWFWKWELVDTGVSDLKNQSVRYLEFSNVYSDVCIMYISTPK